MSGRTKSKKDTVHILDRLGSGEADAVLRLLLEKHPELQSEIQAMAQNIMSSVSLEDVAADVFSALSSVDLDDLNGRAGKHSWGYVEPSEAAYELLQEAIEDWVEDMKRRVEFDLETAAQDVCVGIVSGLYQSRNTKSDGALGWAPDFPAEHAGGVVRDFFQLCRYKMNAAARESLLRTLATHAPEWKDMFSKVAQNA